MSGAADIVLKGERRVFEAESCLVVDRTCHATGRWRRRTGPGYAALSYSDRCSRSWPMTNVAEVRWHDEPKAAA